VPRGRYRPESTREAFHAMSRSPRRPTAGRQRVVVTAVAPEVDCGRFPIKRTVGEQVVVEADIFCDGHDVLAAVVRHRGERQAEWSEVPMVLTADDRWRAAFTVAEIGRHHYTVVGWIDRFRTWCERLRKKSAAGQDVAVDLLAGAELVAAAARRARGRDGKRLREVGAALASEKPAQDRVELALDADLLPLMDRWDDRRLAASYERELSVVVEREPARFSAWYELFPRSTAAQPGRHGTLRDCIASLPYVAGMGFDVLYLPPVHPIGRVNRKGPNNVGTAGDDDPGSPWAIGSAEGGHTAIHPQLGSFDDFRALVAAAHEHGLEIAIDIAFQCAPDHPWVHEHPEWFRHNPDGTIQYAENPPKKYEDVYPIDFETENWEELWDELAGVVQFWVEQGVRIFRVDNPHTKPFAFWEWLIGDVQSANPEVIFLAEAFTRPKLMYRLAKVGFTQSYNYFPWRNTARELEQYFTEITGPLVREYFRANLWPNTPDILTEYLQVGGPAAFRVRLLLAATLGASYGIYGPAFELCENRPLEPGSEEYRDSDKYQLRSWDIDRRDSLKGLITRINAIRRANVALQYDRLLRFHRIDNESMLAYSKRAPGGDAAILVVANLDPYHAQAGWVELDLHDLDLDPRRPFRVHDLLGGASFLWQGARNYVELDPRTSPGYVFQVRRRVRNERDFEYFF
jgi:starch synthase (maltosyl-transferring)